MTSDPSRRTIHVVLVVEAVTYPDLVSVGENRATSWYEAVIHLSTRQRK